MFIPTSQFSWARCGEMVLECLSNPQQALVATVRILCKTLSGTCERCCGCNPPTHWPLTLPPGHHWKAARRQRQPEPLRAPRLPRKFSQQNSPHVGVSHITGTLFGGVSLRGFYSIWERPMYFEAPCKHGNTARAACATLRCTGYVMSFLLPSFGIRGTSSLDGFWGVSGLGFRV